MEDSKERVSQIVDHIMKNCLWQFHSRAWDRLRQNENILGMTAKILLDEKVEIKTPDDKCYWVDAVCLADACRKKFSWISSSSREELADVMASLKERMDFLTVTGSLNEELTDKHY
ncbi:MAG: Fe-only nitrogenase subunit delta [Clostridiales bacterium]|jgi:nitrogenase delta subunit|nr:Fe-only nitrogenase subunit delta [Clostridiales bacterium]MDR2750894.1 Fe-only nitrogenase subunit delta [Clostridiales bacterium]